MSIAISVHLKNRNVYIIGGGNVAYRKASAYLKEGANLTIIAPNVVNDLYELEDIHIVAQPFSWCLVKDAFMIYVATDDECLNAKIVKEAGKRNIVCGCANHLENASFFSMKQEDYTHLQIAISTKASFPYASRVFLNTIHTQIEYFNEKLQSLHIIRNYILTQKKCCNVMILEVLSTLSNDTLKMMKQAIIQQKKLVILAYHGVADITNVALDMSKMKNLCEEANILSINAFISTKAVSKARGKGFEIDELESITNICEVLDLSYSIQPMLISKGVFMKRLQAIYDSNKLGKVLCNREQDVQEIISFLASITEEAMCLLYHKSESDIAHHLKQHDIYAFAYDEDIPKLSEPSITLQCFSILIGYHAHKDVEQTWIPVLRKQGVKVNHIQYSLLSYEVVRMKFMQRIQTIV